MRYICFIGIFLSLSTVFGQNLYSSGFGGLGAGGKLGGKDIYGLIRPYGSIGYGSNGDENASGNLFYSGGVQMLFTGGNALIYGGGGIELAYKRFAQSETLSGPVDSSYYSSYLIGEVHFIMMNLQIGLGPAIGVGDLSGVNLGLMSAIGFNLIGREIGFSAMVRGDWVFDTRTAGSVSLMAGVVLPLR